MWRETLITAATLYGIYRINRWVRHKGSEDDAAFHASILAEAAEMVAARLGCTVAELVNHLMNGTSNSVTKPIARVEYVATKLNPSQCECKIVVGLTGDTGIVAISGTRVFNWEHLPSTIRHDFLRDSGKPQTYVLFEHPKESEGNHHEQ